MLFCVAVCHIALSGVGVVLRCVGMFYGCGCGCVALRCGVHCGLVYWFAWQLRLSRLVLCCVELCWGYVVSWLSCVVFYCVLLCVVVVLCCVAFDYVCLCRVALCRVGLPLYCLMCVASKGVDVFYDMCLVVGVLVVV